MTHPVLASSESTRTRSRRDPSPRWVAPFTAIALAIGVAAPTACATALDGGVFGSRDDDDDDDGEGGAGGHSGDGGAFADGPAPASGPGSGAGPVSGTGGITTSSSVGPSSSSVGQSSVASTSGISSAQSSSSGGGGVCCAASGFPGCSDAGVESCVCGSDPYCCDTAWDGQCVGEVDSLGCGNCGSSGSGGGSGCCAVGGIGCSDPNVEACVCGGDPYCCDTEWDSLCVDEVTDFGCGACP